jgi:general secretion pathway protein G
MNMLRKGFTLIELLIVITIIAILAGAAIPYVADYVEQSKVSRCKVDMSRVRDALTRWELDRSIWPSDETSPAKLVGPYLQKAAVDPWGKPYKIDGYRSLVYSCGPNQNDDKGTGDDIAQAFRPRMAATKVQWVDNTGDGTIDIGDSIVISCTRPVLSTSLSASTPGSGDQITLDGGDTIADVCGTSAEAQGRKAVFIIDTAFPTATPAIGSTVSVGTAANQTSSISDESTVSGVAWSAAQALKLDDYLVLQSE